MTSRLKTGADLPRPIGLSSVQPDSVDDRAHGVALRWLVIERERHRLEDVWAATEAFMAKSYNWFALSDRERADHPAGQLMEALDRRIAKLGKRNERLLERLLRQPATTPGGIMACLQILAELVHPAENEEAHRLIRQITSALEVRAAAQ
ncbi:hypothetical protein P7B02_11515 [Caulobacter segnis]|uniref:hypothetical protein n=1 Tax=Caulobacter segnis TaxID=88688 RepID=UPI002410A01B|nr:hypothetical protein [Caulobacter segnis]MDG2522169.1 hypothetical protein [Caulobacter segnis]